MIVIAATNFAESLDPALTRPGRFDRRVHVALPDVAARTEILELYVRCFQCVCKMWMWIACVPACSSYAPPLAAGVVGGAIKSSHNKCYYI